MNRRTATATISRRPGAVALLAVALVATLAVACGGDEPEGTVATASGVGDGSKTVELAGGAHVVDLTYSGTDLFQVELAGTAGTVVVIPVLTHLGAYEGSRIARLAAGSYVLDVRADGAWSARIREPGQARLPFALSGRGDAVTPLLTLSSRSEFVATHRGEGEFLVRVWTARGASLAVLADTTGDFDGVVPFRASPGLYIISIESRGDWTIEVRTLR